MHDNLTIFAVVFGHSAAFLGTFHLGNGSSAMYFNTQSPRRISGASEKCEKERREREMRGRKRRRRGRRKGGGAQAEGNFVVSLPSFGTVNDHTTFSVVVRFSPKSSLFYFFPLDSEPEMIIVDRVSY